MNERHPKTNKIRVLIGGGFHSEKVQRLETCLHDGIEICGIVAHRQHVKSGRSRFPAPVWLYDELVKPDLVHNWAPSPDQYEGCLDFILSDPRTAYFCERYYGVHLSDSVFNHTVQVEIACWNSLAILNELQPDRIVYMGIVHRLTKWIFGRCAEYLGIPTYFTLRSPLRWRYWAVRGIDERRLVRIRSEDETESVPDTLSGAANRYLERVRESYDVGIPAYMKKYVWSWPRELRKTLARKPEVFWRRTQHLRRKLRAFSTYNRLSVSSALEGPYVVLLLHYQPEATSLPSGYKYVQQWLVVRAIAQALPENCKLIVKEHPSMFAKRFSEQVRDKTFYESIASLRGVALAPIDSDPFEVIDRSVAVATLTGTAGFEALCRSRPVLTFGAAAYEECPGAFAVKGIAEVAAALRSIANGEAIPTNERLTAYLKWVELHSIEGRDCTGPDDWRAEKVSKLEVWQRLIAGEEPSPAVTFKDWKAECK